jgi:vacuolar-type H+-ATPase subunit E/Vma4
VRQYERQIVEISSDAQKTAAAQVEAVKKNLKAAFAVDLKRILLRSRDQVFRRTLDGVEEAMAQRVAGREYRRVLFTLIVEAAIGLGAETVEVNATPEELALIDDALLAEAAGKVSTLVLKKVGIRKSQAAPLLLQGIVLGSANGKTAYNNQVRTRLLRNQSAIRKLIYDRLQLA